MTSSNTTAQFVSDVDGSTADLTIRSIVRMRPDNTSSAATFDIGTKILEQYSAHGAWLSVIVLDLPAGLTPGTGVINVNTSATFGSPFGGIDMRPFGIEILAGTGSSNPLEYFDETCANCQSPVTFSRLEPLQQVVVRPPVIDGTPNWWAAPDYSAAEIIVNVPMQKISDGSAVPDTGFRVVHDDMYYRSTAHQTGMIWKRTGDDITVYFTSPTGAMNYFETRFSVVLSTVYEFIGAPVVTSVTFYDSDGNVVTADTPDASYYTATREHEPM